MADVEAARRFIAGEFEDAGLPHVAGAILAGTSPFGQGAYIAAVAAALEAPCAGCTCQANVVTDAVESCA